MALTIFNTLFLVAYLLSALVQFNDPDALPWIIIYLAAAGMCLMQYRTASPRWLPATLLGICMVWIAFLLPAIIGQVTPTEIFESVSMRTRAVEEAREIGGLALVATWAAVLTFKARA